MFLSILGPKIAPSPTTILIIFGYFLGIFRHFSLSRLFQRFWLISHAQDDQEQPKSIENSMEKDNQNPSQGLPKGSKSPLYGRAVAPALPAQFPKNTTVTTTPTTRGLYPLFLLHYFYYYSYTKLKTN